MKIEPFYKENKEHLFSLIKSIYNTETNDDFWNWRIFNEKFGKPIQYGMWDGDELIGYHVLHPIPMKIKKNTEKILFSMATMTHPDYRGQGIFLNLAKISYETAIKSGYKFIIGFPNTNSQKTFFGKLNWINLGNISEFYTNKFEPLIDPNNYQISKINQFDERINKIWSSNKDNYDFIVQRDMNYLNWRFVEIPKIKFKDQSKSEYFCFLLEDEKPETYFVIKKFGNEKAHIVDIFGKLNNDIMNRILKHSFEFCNKNKITYLSLLADFNLNEQYIHSILHKHKFKKKISETFRGSCLLNDDMKKLITKDNNWYYTMSDSYTY